MSSAVFVDAYGRLGGTPEDVAQARSVYARLLEAHGPAAEAAEWEHFDHWFDRMQAAGRAFVANFGDLGVTERLSRYREMRAAEANGAVIINQDGTDPSEHLAREEPEPRSPVEAEALLADPVARAARLAEIMAPATQARAPTAPSKE